jgi:hypothetical protein
MRVDAAIPRIACGATERAQVENIGQADETVCGANSSPVCSRTISGLDCKLLMVFFAASRTTVQE